MPAMQCPMQPHPPAGFPQKLLGVLSTPLPMGGAKPGQGGEAKAAIPTSCHRQGRTSELRFNQHGVLAVVLTSSRRWAGDGGKDRLS